MVSNGETTIIGVLLVLMLGVVVWVAVVNLDDLNFDNFISLPFLSPNDSPPAEEIVAPELPGQPVERIQDFPVIRPGGDSSVFQAP